MAPSDDRYFWPTKIRREVVRRLWAHQQELCCYCLVKMRQADDRPRKKIDATIDHVIPISKGGGEWALWNVMLACHRCNTVKGDRIWPLKIPIAYGEGVFEGLDHWISNFDMRED